ncbi:hypothetical protein MBLNU459_g0168t1 [Dothideomycetes sp. NU459]
MALWSVSLLILSITYLTYRHPPSSWTVLPLWLRPAKRIAREDVHEQEHATNKTGGREEAKTARQEPDAETKKSMQSPAIPRSTAAISGRDQGEEQDQEQVQEGEEGDRTPRAAPAVPSASVPSFALDDSHTTVVVQQRSDQRDDSSGDDDDNDDDTDNAPPPVFPALNSAQRASAPLMPAPPKPAAASSPSLMPPPSRSTPSLMPPPSRAQPGLAPPSSASSLRVPNGSPARGPLPNRGPPLSAAAAQARGGLAPSRIDTPKSRNKVQLTPGHSPLDWASLSRSTNLSGVSTFTRVTPSQLKKHNGRKGAPAWSVYQGKVYNVSPYLPFHPGGEGELLRAAGKDGTKLFMEVHPWVNWDNMLQSCMVGILVSETEVDEGLEGLD